MTTNSPILGSPLPQDPHAVSVSLPTWKAVCGYEEGDPNVCSQLQTGYPRFKIHSYVEMICQELLSSYTNDYNIPMSCMVWPNERVAERCIHFLKVSDTFLWTRIQSKCDIVWWRRSENRGRKNQRHSILCDLLPYDFESEGSHETLYRSHVIFNILRRSHIGSTRAK